MVDVIFKRFPATPPLNVDVAFVDVASKLPTVDCVPVAMSAVPAAFEVMMEFGEKDVAFVPPFAMVSAEARERTPVELNDEVAVEPK